MEARTESPSELSVEVAGVVAGIAIPATLRDGLARRLAGPMGRPLSPPSVRYRITTDAPGLYGLERDHGSLRHHIEADIALDALVGDLPDALRRSRPGIVLARGGAVAVSGQGIVVLGPPGAGTSTLVDALVASGADLLSDGLVAFDRSGRVHPIVLGGDAVPGADRAHAPETPEAVPVCAVVTTVHDTSSDWAPVEISGARAALPLLGHVVPNQQQSSAARSLLGNLAPHVVLFDGPRPDASRVAADLIARTGQRPAVDLPAPAVESGGQEALGPVRPARFLRFDDLLDPEEHRHLLERTLARAEEFAPSEVLTQEDVDDQAVLRRSETVFELEEVWDLFEPKLVSLLPHIRRELGIEWFDLGPFERQLTSHGDGDHFTLHIDDGSPDVASRVVSFVYYFNREPWAFSGGELRLFDTVDIGGRVEPTESFTEVIPADNTLVAFGSDVPHEVRPVHVPGNAFGDRRFTIVCWARRRPTAAELFSGDADRLAELQRELLPASY